MSENTDEDENTESEDESGESEPELGENEHVVQLPGKQVVTGPHSDEPPEYHRIVVADAKPKREYNTYERRAVLLDRIEQAGHPRALPSTYQELSDEFGTAKSTIAGDMSRLSEYVAENLEREHHTIVDSVFRGAILDLVQEGKKAWAAEVAKEWYEWLADMGEVERVADDVNLNINESEGETDAYEIVEDEPSIKSGDDLPESET
jgi:hypothetical protein